MIREWLRMQTMRVNKDGCDGIPSLGITLLPVVGRVIPSRTKAMHDGGVMHGTV